MINGMPKSGKFTIKKSTDPAAPGASKNLVRDHLAGPRRASPTEDMDFDDVPAATAPNTASRPPGCAYLQRSYIMSCCVFVLFPRRGGANVIELLT
jgi:hypothetical protein